MESLAGANKQSWLGWFFRGLILLGLLIILARLLELQVIKGGYFKSLSESNRIRRIPITSARGRILSRGGEVLVGNKEVKKRIVFNPESGFTKSLDMSSDPEGETITEFERSYLLGKKFAHVSGYLGEVNEDEVGRINPECPAKGPRTLGAFIGRSGLEEVYECTLSGIDGEELVEVDASGKRVRILGTKEPTPGSDLKTYIHRGLQEKVAEVMQDKKGAVVATNPGGEILALYSSPSFDPDLFVGERDSEKISQALSDPNLLFFNRAIGGAFHPGSVFKLVVATAALEEEKIDEDFRYEDTGIITVNDFEYTNWYFTQYGGTEGEIGITRAIARSTDTFFYKIGEFLGAESISSWSRKFGLGEGLGVDLPGEIKGLIPSPSWKKTVKGENWFLGNTYHLAIGQGDIALTPLEVNTGTSVVAGDGRLCLPRIASEPVCRELDIEKESISLVKEGMVEACSAGGTGFTFFDFEPRVACKTGTAETEEDDKTHAWFTVFAPVENPEIILTVLVEKGGEGSSVAGPVARETLNYWFHEKDK